ncbi:MAG: terpene cyclase/mutase family protein [Planctomycetes bacterium]|nr:terpene cyclase/mutase family protein [Planctomycetota bacterium]
MHPFLARTQHADGGWGYLPDTTSFAEPTCLALLAVPVTPDSAPAPASPDDAGLRKAAAWLAAAQLPDGSLRVCAEDDGGSWTTSLALFALTRRSLAPACRDAARDWLLANQAAHVPSDANHKFDETVRGWAWYGNTFTWLEPTAYALLALKAGGLRRHTRIDEAHRALLDRSIPSGGWNLMHNNSFGVSLEPLPRATAIILLALQDLAEEPRVRKAVQYLRDAAPRSRSPVARGWSALALSAFGEDVAPLRRSLASELREKEGVGENVYTTALALLALDAPERNPFLLP